MTEHLNGERFDALFKAQILIEAWRHEYNRIRPHSSLGYHSPREFIGEATLQECCAD